MPQTTTIILSCVAGKCLAKCFTTVKLILSLSHFRSPALSKIRTIIVLLSALIGMVFFLQMLCWLLMCMNR